MNAIYYPVVPQFDEVLINKLEVKFNCLKNAVMARHDPTRSSRVSKIMDEMEDIMEDLEDML